MTEFLNLPALAVTITFFISAAIQDGYIKLDRPVPTPRVIVAKERLYIGYPPEPVKTETTTQWKTLQPPTITQWKEPKEKTITSVSVSAKTRWRTPKEKTITETQEKTITEPPVAITVTTEVTSYIMTVTELPPTSIKTVYPTVTEPATPAISEFSPKPAVEEKVSVEFIVRHASLAVAMLLAGWFLHWLHIYLEEGDFDFSNRFSNPSPGDSSPGNGDPPSGKPSSPTDGTAPNGGSGPASEFGPTNGSAPSHGSAQNQRSPNNDRSGPNDGSTPNGGSAPSGPSSQPNNTTSNTPAAYRHPSNSGQTTRSNPTGGGPDCFQGSAANSEPSPPSTPKDRVLRPADFDEMYDATPSRKNHGSKACREQGCDCVTPASSN